LGAYIRLLNNATDNLNAGLTRQCYDETFDHDCTHNLTLIYCFVFWNICSSFTHHITRVHAHFGIILTCKTDVGRCTNTDIPVYKMHSNCVYIVNDSLVLCKCSNIVSDSRYPHKYRIECYSSL